MKIILGNIDYQKHTTNEGDQFQRGLANSGWTLVGPGCDDRQDVQEILDHYQPTHVVVHDPRDWDPESPISFRKDIGYQNLSALSRAEGVKRYVVYKDAGSSVEYQKKMANHMGVDGLITYYHTHSVHECAPWTGKMPLIRTYHTLDRHDAERVPWMGGGDRRRAMVSGAVSGTYPMRQLVFGCAGFLGVDTYRHPGYGNRGSRTTDYLNMIGTYRVHVCTSSKYKFALRKIIESVAMGCTPVTDLPEYDCLPGIDDALIRVENPMDLREIEEAIKKADEGWHEIARKEWSLLAQSMYDWRRVGWDLSESLI